MINKIKELEDEILKLQEESKLKTNWISLITHDLKEVFGSLLWIIEAYGNKTIAQDVFLSMLPEIKRGAEKNLQTITDTGEWIKTQYGNFTPIYEKLFLYELFLILQEEFSASLHSKKISLGFQGNENLYLVNDRILTLFILRKILNNAIKYSYEGGVVSFEVHENNDRVKLCITDMGIGMKASSLNGIFSFDGTVNSGTKGEKGAGLSLKIVKDFVSLIQGEIEVSSEQNRGTAVTLKFPYHQNHKS